MEFRIWSVIFLTLLGVNYCTSQTGFVVDSQNELYRLQDGCQTERLFSIGNAGAITDIALDPQGNLYALTTTGDLYLIDTLNETVTKVHSFLYLQDFYALACDVNGTFYLSGSEGYLYSYELQGDREHFFGDVGVNITGDLVIYHGYLYASTDNGQLVQLDLLHPTQTHNVAKLPHKSAGLMLLGNKASTCPDGKLVSIGIDGKAYQYAASNASFDLVCTFEFAVAGAAGKDDFAAPDALLQSQFRIRDADCFNQNAGINIRWRPEQAGLQFAINGMNHKLDSVFSGLSAGSYQLKTTNAQGCIDTLRLELGQEDGPVIQSIRTQNAPCQLGSGSLEVTAFGAGIAGYQMDDQDIQATGFFNKVTPGAHFIIVMDSSGCQAKDTVEVNFESNEELFSYQVTPSTCDQSNGAITVQPVSPSIRFALDNGVLQDSPSFEALAAGTYLVRALDSVGCGQEVEIIVPDHDCEIFIPTAFSPDQDGVNDYFQIYYQQGKERLVEAYQIFDRWGALIYATGGFSIHANDHWWDGTTSGRQMATGVYIYRIVLTDSQGQQEVKQGTVTLLH